LLQDSTYKKSCTLIGFKVKFKSNNAMITARVGVSRNFMYSEVTPKNISQIKMVIELEAVCREISYIESGVSFAKKG